MNDNNKFDVLKLPLKGFHCIEASAGTGKTYSIVFLVLRLLLERSLNINRILVVTYTNAATEEIRGRIREKLSDTLGILEKGNGTNDALLRRFCDGIPADKRKTVALNLRRALSGINEAPVCTIHSFCRRMLEEFAFESGVAFDVDLIGDDAELWFEAVADFWRKKIAESSEQEVIWMIEKFGTPEKLWENLSMIIRPDLLGMEAGNFSTSGAEDGNDDLKSLYDKFSGMREIWNQSKNEIVEILKDYEGLNRKAYSKNIVSRSIEAMDEFLEGCHFLELPQDFERFTKSKLKKSTRSGCEPPQHKFFDLCEDYKELLNEIPYRIFRNFLIEARDFALKRVRSRKLDEKVFSFDDLLTELDRALEGSSGLRLARAIRSRYPVALIDEFQDTDSVQYRIFRKIYYSSGDDKPFVCMIGDPKQAIYGFRGADVFAYMLAKRPENIDKLWTMDTNWRSDKKLVCAINTIFGSHSDPFIYEEIPYEAVKSALSSEETEPVINGETSPPFRIRFLSKEAAEIEDSKAIPKGRAEEIVALDCAKEIARLLKLASEGKALVGGRPIAPGDIAVLVPSHRLGSVIQQALRRFNVAGVTVSRESVFASEEARDLTVILEGVVASGDSQRVRAALATETMGWTAREIAELNSNDLLMDEVQNRFSQYLTLWQRSGFLTFFMEFLRREGVVEKLSQRPDGERRLTDILHLAELIHQVHARHQSIDLTMRWFRERIDQAGEKGEEEEQLRLESDENLVQILTVHKSKGLEFPVVFCPFLWWELGPQKSRKEQNIRIYHDPETLELKLDLGARQTDGVDKLVEKERLSEAVRLAYVALTRARSMCVMHWGPIKYSGRSGMAWVFFGENTGKSENSGDLVPPIDDADEKGMFERLKKLADNSSGAIALEQIDKADRPKEALVDAGAGPESVPIGARKYSRSEGVAWLVSSYSGLVFENEPELQDFWFEESPLTGEEAEESVDDPIPSFPAGPRAGSCIHEIFQNIDFSAGDEEEINAVIRDTLRRYGFDPAQWFEGARTMITNTLNTPLDSDGLKLKKINNKNRRSEVEFHFRVDDFCPDKIREILDPYPLYRDSIEGLHVKRFRGLFHGYIDLIFKWGNAYYIVDYKTNVLGKRQSDYSKAALEQAMIAHRYPLQILLYTLALHRHLSVCIRDYDYSLHMGGVFYLFCRGMNPERGAEYGVFYQKPPEKLIKELDGIFCNPAFEEIT